MTMNDRAWMMLVLFDLIATLIFFVVVIVIMSPVLVVMWLWESRNNKETNK